MRHTRCTVCSPQWIFPADSWNPPVFQVSANGNVLRSEIVGSIKMRVFLSGMPELRLGLNDKVLFENTGREFSAASDTILCLTSLYTPNDEADYFLILPCLGSIHVSYTAAFSLAWFMIHCASVVLSRAFLPFLNAKSFHLGGKSKSVELEDVKFHQCVRLSRFENDRTISFIPPDGEFELMSYRLNTHVSIVGQCRCSGGTNV